MVADGQPRNAVLAIQRLLDAGDSFVFTENSDVIQNSRRFAVDLLQSDSDLLEAYESSSGSTARGLFDEATSTSNEAKLREVARRYELTKAGFDAIHRLAVLHFDRGEFASAQHLLARSFQLPSHRQRFTVSQRLRLGLSYALNGHMDQAKQHFDAVGDRDVRVGGHTIQAKWWTTRIEKQLGHMRLPSTNGSGLVVQNVRSNPMPYMRPIWQVPLVQSLAVRKLVDTWERERRYAAPSRSVAVPNFAAIAGDAVVVRDHSNVRGLDITTGEVQWTYRLSASATKFIAAKQQGRATATEILEHHGLLWNGLLGTISTDTKRAYVIDGFDFNSRSSAGFNAIKDAPSLDDKREAFVAPKSNRLVAIDLAAAARSSQEDVQPLWTTAGPAVSLEWFDQYDLEADGVINRDEFVNSGGDFDAFDLNGDNRIQRAEAKKAMRTRQPQGGLLGHFFLGPPLAIDSRLFAVTEFEREIYVVALEAATGTTLWTQPIASTPVGIEADARRATHPCVPAFLNGTLIVPTQLGVLAALDAMDGSLLWASPVPDHDPNPGFQRVPGFWADDSQRETPSLVHSHGDRLIWMPPFSKWIFCLDASTGQRIWRTDRVGNEHMTSGANRDQFIGIVTNDVVFIVGNRECRAVKLSDGSQLWHRRIGTPSGRGVFGNEDGASGKYVLPLQDGRVAAIDVMTGDITAMSGTHDDSTRSPLDELAAELPDSAGNLIVADDVVISIGPRFVTAYRRAAHLQQLANQQPASEPTPIARRKLLAEISEALGDRPSAIRQLTAVWDANQDAHTENMLRSLLMEEIKRTGDTKLFEQARPLCRTQSDRVQLLALEANSAIAGQDLAAVIDIAKRVRKLGLRQPVAFGENAEHRMSVDAWVRQLWTRARESFTSHAAQTAASYVVETTNNASLPRDDMPLVEQRELLRQAANDFDGWTIHAGGFDTSLAGMPRLRLARLYAEHGNFHAAEMTLLRCRADDPLTWKAAESSLQQLWQRLGLNIEAAAALKSQMPDDEFRRLLDLSRGEPDLPYPAADWQSKLALEQVCPPQLFDRLAPVNHDASPKLHVRIQANLWNHNVEQIHQAFTGYRGRYHLKWGNTFCLLDKGTDEKSHFDVIDHQSGTTVNSINVPLRRSFPSVTRQSHVGHFFPMGATGKVVGVSLLDREQHEPVWSQELLDLPGPARLVLTGTAGPEFCAVQSQGTLAVLDSISGEVRWQRDDLMLATGLISDPAIGMFGDKQVLTVLDANGRGYTVYRTSDGEVMARGEIPAKPRTPRFKFGRRLFFVAETPDGDRYRLWDPLTNNNAIDDTAMQPITGRYLVATTPGGNIAYISADASLRVFDVTANKQVVDFELSDFADPWDRAQISSLRVFRWQDTFLVNLQKTNNMLGDRVTSYYATNNFTPSIHVQGELLAIDAKTGRRVWRESVPCLSIVNPRHIRLPFLVAFSRVSDQSTPGTTRQTMTVSVIDPTTGETITERNSLFPDRILHFSYEPTRRSIDFHGIYGRIRVAY